MPGATALTARSPRSDSRTRRGMPTLSRPIRLGANNMRACVSSWTKTDSILPSSLRGPMSEVMIGASTISVRSFATEKPMQEAAMIVQRKRRPGPSETMALRAMAPNKKQHVHKQPSARWRDAYVGVGEGVLWPRPRGCHSCNRRSATG